MVPHPSSCSSFLAAALLALASMDHMGSPLMRVQAFAVLPAASRTGHRVGSNSNKNNQCLSTTGLGMISSWGTKGPPSRWDTQSKDPEKYIQDYLAEPEAVEARNTIDGTVLVSGVSNRPDRTDQFLFDLLNHEDSAFEFTKICAFVDTAAAAKKRLLSRSARYTGLLDKLDFVEAPTPGALPTAEHLKGAKSWLAVLEPTTAEDNGPITLLDRCQEIASTAGDCPELANVAILLMGANDLDASACQAAVDALSATGKQYTVVAVGQVSDETPEGMHPYHYAAFGAEDGVLPAKAVFSRQEAYRMVAELLQLECGVNQALAFAEIYNVNATETQLVRGLREAGYDRMQEIDHMVRLGPKAYLDAIEEFRKENPDAAKGYTTNAWWEGEEYQKSRQRSDERMAAKLQAVKDERTMEIEAVAKEWVKREYFRCSMAGTVQDDMTEEEFSKTVWDRALLEGDLRYRQSKGEVVNEDDELADFAKRQERKQETMLKRAKEELKAIMQEDVDDDEDDDDDDDDKAK